MKQSNLQNQNAVAPVSPGKAIKKDDAAYKKPSYIVRVKGGVDRPMLIIVVLLLCFGSVMVFSASFANALSTKGDSYYYIKRQIAFALAGCVVMFVATRIDYRVFKRLTNLVFFSTIVLLIIVLIYGVANNSAVRWIKVGGTTVQPSEIMKLALVLLLAKYYSKYEEYVLNYKNFKVSSMYGDIIPMGILAGVLGLVALEKHFSGVIILLLIGVAVMFAAGARLFWFGVFGGAGVALITVGIFATSYARSRLDAWLHPENYEVTNEIWQTTQGLYAVGSGGFLGVGLGSSRQKQMYVSEPQNDFIFSIICEELGYVGAIAVVALFILLIWRGFVIARYAPDTFSRLVVIGITCKVGIQAILNISVVTALVPNTGVTLPFFSYGGSALLMLLCEMGIVLSISRYRKREDKPPNRRRNRKT